MKRTRMVLQALLLALSLVPAILCSTTLQAQEATTGDQVRLPDPLTPETVQSLVARLSDVQVRDLLLQELAARIQVPVATVEPSLIDSVSQTFSSATVQIVQAVVTSPAKVAALVNVMADYFTSLGTTGTIRLLAVLVAALVVGFAVDRFYARRLAARTGGNLDALPETLTFPQSVPFLARRLLRDAGGALLALVTAAIVLNLLLPEQETRVGMTVVLWLAIFPRLAWIVLRFILSPDRTDLRLVTTDDGTARVLTRNLVGLVIVIGMVETILHVAQEIGADGAALNVGFWFNVIIFVWLAVVVIVCRNGLRSIVHGGQVDLTATERWVVRAYPTYALAVIGLTWIAGVVAVAIGKEEVIRDGRHFLSLALLLIAPMGGTLIRSTVRMLVSPLTVSGHIAMEAHASVFNSYVNIARVLVFGTILIILAALWDIPLFGNSGGAPDEPFSGRFVVAVLIVAVGYVVLEIASLLINHKLAHEHSDEDPGKPGEADEGPVGGGTVSRLGTILPPVSWALQAAIIIVTALTALSHLGVNVTALLAGAGVLGIAIGFGAQKLVADVVSGLFFLVDDAFRLNEYIDAGGVQGTVEKIALRSILLRESNGAIHCLPYSNINSISNLGRDWGTMKQVFTVPFDTDIEKVRKIFKKIGQDLMANPELKDAFIQPFKYKGVSQVNDVGIVVRGKFMFKPELAKQFLINREIFRRVHADFAAAGIQFARREVRVNVDTKGVILNDAETRSIAATAAASEAAMQAEISATAAKTKPAS